MNEKVKMADFIKSKFKKAFNHTKSQISQQIQILIHDERKNANNNDPYQCQKHSKILNDKLKEFNLNLDEIMANKDLNRICSFSHPSNLKLDPRDERILIPFQSNYYSHLKTSSFSISFQPFNNQICDWLIDVIQVTTSISFNHMKMETLTDIQAKAFACKNILLNIKDLFERYSKIPLQYRINLMNFINQSAKKIFQNIIFKYPQNNSCGASKRVKSRVPKINDLQSDEFDFLLKNNIQIQYRQDGDYSQDIMKVINKLSTFMSETFDPNDELLQTNYEVFAGIMEYIFENCNIQSADSINKEISRVIQCKKNLQRNQSDADNLLKNQFLNIGEEDTKRSSFIKDSHKIFSIGQKIPNGIDTFSEQDMEGSNFHIHDSSILRLLTKWAEQLKNKLNNAEESILKRLYKFKNSNGKFINLESDLRAKLYQAAISQSEKIEKQYKYLKKQNNYLLTLFAKEENKMKYSKNDSKVGLFAAKINKISGHYIFRYINKLIHSLLTLPKLASMEVTSDHNRLLIGSVNLVTFKIGDLMRSKCSCSQQEFIKILMILEEMHQKSPNIIKIIRVKNRLQHRNNDILINFFFMNKVECQLQLSITGNSNKNQKNTSTFEHFLYQILRSQLGPISQMAIILAKFDPLINLYSKQQSYRQDFCPDKMSQNKKKQRSDKISERVKLKLKLKQEIANDIELPFICSVCHNLSIVHNPHLLFRDPNSQTIQCDDCCLMKLKQKQKSNDVKSVVQYLVQKQDIIDQDQKKFFKIHILFRHIEQIIKEAQNASSNMVEVNWLTKRGYILRTNQKTPKLQLYSAVYDKITQNVIFAKLQDGIKKVLSKISIHRNKAKRIENYQRQFKKILLFELEKCKQIIQNNIIYYQCSQQGCCNLKFKAGVHLPTYEILQKTHKVMIEDCIENKINVLYISSVPRAFDKLGKVMKHIVSGPKIQKIKNNIQAIEANLCELENIHIVSNFRNIFQLNIRENPKIISLKGIENCLQLKFLNCKKCNINDINQLSKLEKLEYLNISYNKNFKCLKGLQNHKQLLQLFLGNTSVDSLLYLQGCVKLESLSLRNCTQITSLQTIKSQKLSYLNVVNCNKLKLFDLPLLTLQCLKSLQIHHEDYPQTITQSLILSSLKLVHKYKPDDAINKIGSIIKRKKSKIVQQKQQRITVSQTYMQNKSFVIF